MYSEFLYFCQNVTEENNLSPLEKSIRFEKLTEQQQNMILQYEIFNIFNSDISEQDDLTLKLIESYNIPGERFIYVVDNFEQIGKEAIEYFERKAKNLETSYNISLNSKGITASVSDEELEDLNSDKETKEFLLETEEYEVLAKLK